MLLAPSKKYFEIIWSEQGGIDYLHSFPPIHACRWTNGPKLIAFPSLCWNKTKRSIGFGIVSQETNEIKRFASLKLRSWFNDAVWCNNFSVKTCFSLELGTSLATCTFTLLIHHTLVSSEKEKSAHTPPHYYCVCIQYSPDWGNIFPRLVVMRQNSPYGICYTVGNGKIYLDSSLYWGFWD